MMNRFAPAASHGSIYFSGCSTIRCTSRLNGARRFAHSVGFAHVLWNVNAPSATSRWKNVRRFLKTSSRLLTRSRAQRKSGQLMTGMNLHVSVSDASLYLALIFSSRRAYFSSFAKGVVKEYLHDLQARRFIHKVRRKREHVDVVIVASLIGVVGRHRKPRAHAVEFVRRRYPRRIPIRRSQCRASCAGSALTFFATAARNPDNHHPARALRRRTSTTSYASFFSACFKCSFKLNPRWSAPM